MALENLREAKITALRRKLNLFKKAAKFSTLCGARVAIVVISKKGNKEEKLMNNEVAEECVDSLL
ncbi:hypothetical protein Goari_022015, partial [Gossypium aridum]|nr:hypothetical protein [Gossypium aridum]